MQLMNKGQVLEQVLADEAMAFLDHMVSVEGAAVRLAWESLENVDLESALLQSMLESLIPAVLTQAVEDRRAALVAGAVPQEVALAEDVPLPESTFAHVYRVPIPAGVVNPYTWIGAYLTQHCEAVLEGSTLLVKTDGLCRAPNTVEVI